MRSTLVSMVFAISILRMHAQGVNQDWHPSISEDNKAATWDDTVNFIADTVNNNPGSFLITAPGGHLYDNIWMTTHIEKGEACHLQADKYIAAYWGRRYERQHDVIDLSGVDPISITVAKLTFNSDPKHLASGFVITFSGKNSKTVVDWKAWDYHDDFAWNTDTSLKTTLFTCEGKGKSCKEESGERPKEFVWTNDDELAKRLARALLHASMLCGGAKSVSPF
jgi:hypothetical protein